MLKISGIERLVRPEVAGLGGYVPSKSPETLEGEVEVPVEAIIKLDGNENLFGCSPRVQQALASFPYLNIYPDAEQGKLRKLLSEYIGVGPEHIVAGNGSDELIGYVMRSFVGHGDEVVNCIPTFDIFRHRTQLCGGTLVEVLRDENFAVDVAAIKAAITRKTKIILLATPNNPTGTIIPQKDILEIVNIGLPVLVDEAYAEFSGETVSQLVPRYENLIVLRTFSKWAGLAGLRVGYGIFPPKIAGYLMKMKEPYNVNVAAVIAVRESLEDLDYLRKNVRAIITERDRLFAEFKKLEFLKPYPSRANFIFCSVLNGKAKQIQERMQQKGILIRYFDLPLLRSAVRIGVGRPEQNDTLLKALREVSRELG